MIYVRDLDNNEYPLVSTIVNKDDVYGNNTLETVIEPNHNNLKFLDKMTEMWTIVDHSGVEHKIIFLRKQGKGHKMTARTKAVPLFSNQLRRYRYYPRLNKHMTAQECYGYIFDSTGFKFVLVDHFDAIDWEGFGDGKTRMDLFRNANDRYGAEFRIEGDTVYLEKKIGVDLDFQYRHRLNASDIVQEVDAENLYTYIRGYADYDDETEESDGGWETAKIKETYISPLEKVIGRYEAPPVKDGRIKNKTMLLNRMRKTVDESLLVNIHATVVQLRAQKFPESKSRVGDRVFVTDPRINLDLEVRIIRQDITRDFRGNIIDINIEFGSDGLSKRRQSSMMSTGKVVSGIMSGSKKIPIQSIDDSVIRGASDIAGLKRELDIRNGVATKNGNVRFNNSGISTTPTSGVSRPTVTGKGLNADTLYGTIPSDVINIDISGLEDQIGRLQSNVDEVSNKTNTNTQDIVRLNNDMATIQGDIQNIKNDIIEINNRLDNLIGD